jgi:hypothetical protein
MPFKVTFFKNLLVTKLSDFHVEEHELESLAELIRSTSAPTKDRLPLWKLATFGNVPKRGGNDKGGFRHDGNLDVVTGVELDYDKLEVPVEDAIDKMRAAGIACIVHTSPSYAPPDTLKWRVLAPLSTPCLPNERERYADRVSGILGVELARESFKPPSQTFYYGRATDNTAEQIVEIIDGDYIDLRDDLPAVRWTPPKPVGTRKKAKGYEEYKARIGDHEGGGGFNAVITEAVASFIGTHGVDADTEWLLEDLTAAISAADGSKHKAGYAEIKAADLKNMIPNIMAKEIEKASWERDAKNALIHDSQANVKQALAKLGVKLSYDEFNRAELLGGKKELEDHDVDELWLAVDRGFGLRPTDRFWNKMIGHLSHANSFHPVREHLDKLAWDKMPRVGHEGGEFKSWLATYLGAEDTPYTRAVGRLTLMAAVRRIKRPGCKFDQMLVLVDPTQGTGKTTVVQILAGNPGWFTNSLKRKDLKDDKKIMEQLDGKWFVEFGELSVNETEIDDLKEFLSQFQNTAREAYGRRPKTAKRQSVPIGTTNKVEFLSDRQNRRFWPVMTGKIDLVALRLDRDQIIAEATVMEAAADQSDAGLMLPEELWAAAAEVQEEHRQPSPLEGLLSKHLAGLDGRIHSEDVWTIIGKPPGQRTRPDMIAMGSAMGGLKFRAKKIGSRNDQQPYYIKGDAPPATMPRIHVYKNPYPPFEVVATHDEKSPFTGAPSDAY